MRYSVMFLLGLGLSILLGVVTSAASPIVGLIVGVTVLLSTILFVAGIRRTAGNVSQNEDWQREIEKPHSSKVSNHTFERARFVFKKDTLGKPEEVMIFDRFHWDKERRLWLT